MEEKPKLKEGTIVLLLDDDKFLRDMYAVKFKEAGAVVETAESASEALERLKSGFAPAAIMFDVVMPGVDGYAFLEALAKEKLATDSVKVALSNQGQDADIERAKSLGATEYIVKANTIPSEVVTRVLGLLS